jgi:hypothetical protein
MLELSARWGGSSAGRASHSQCEGREFDPPPLNRFKKRTKQEGNFCTIATISFRKNLQVLRMNDKADFKSALSFVELKNRERLKQTNKNKQKPQTHSNL